MGTISFFPKRQGNHIRGFCITLRVSGMAQVRQVITQLEHESTKSDPVANLMAETLLHNWLALKRHRFATDNLAATHSEALLDKLMTALSGSLNRRFVLDHFCEQEQAANGLTSRDFLSFSNNPSDVYFQALAAFSAVVVRRI